MPKLTSTKNSDLVEMWDQNHSANQELRSCKENPYLWTSFPDTNPNTKVEKDCLPLKFPQVQSHREKGALELEHVQFP